WRDQPLDWSEFSDFVRTVEREKPDAIRANPRELARGKRDAAQDEYSERFKEFLNGRGTLDILLEAARHRLEEELALPERERTSLRSGERDWAARVRVESGLRGWYERGRIPIQCYMQGRYHRLTAEIEWLQARAKR